jgi:hypothetical protein
MDLPMAESCFSNIVLPCIVHSGFEQFKKTMDQQALIKLFSSWQQVPW